MSDFKIVSLLNPIQFVSASGILAASAGTQSLSSGTLIFSNSNGVSFGLSNGTLTASVAGGGGGGGGVALSAGTNSTSTGTVVFSNSNGVSFGMNTAGVVTATVATNYAPAGAYLTTAALSQDSSNYAGTNGAITGGSITVNTSGISINLPAYLTTAQPVGAYLTTARASNDAIGLNTAQSNVTWTVNSSGLSLDARGYAGTVTGATNASVTANSNGISVSVAAPVTTNGLISGVNVSAGTTSNNLTALTFSNGSGVSFGLNGSVITATVATNYQSAGAYLTTAMQSDAATISNIKVSAGASSANLSALTFSNSNGLSFGLSAGTITGSYTVPTVTAGSDTFGISNLGNTAGTSGVVSGDSVRLLFAGGNNITLSQSINGLSATITISGANVGGAQTGISGLSAGTTQVTSGTVSFADSNGISFGLNGNTLTATVKTDYLTSQSNQAFSASGGSSAFQTLNFANSNGFTFSNSNGSVIGSYTVPSTVGFLTTARASNDAVGLNTALTANGVSWTVNSSGISLNVPAFLTTAMASNAATISNIKLSAGTVSALRSDITFADSNGVSFGLSANGVITATVATNYQSAGAYLTTARASNDAIGLNTAQSNVTWTVNSSGLSLDARGYAGTATGATNASITVNSGGVSVSVAAPVTTNGLISAINVSGGTTSNNLSAITFSNANGVSFGLNGSVMTATVATNYQSAGAYLTTAMASNRGSDFVQATAAFAGTNASGTIASNGISISVAAPGAAAENNWVNLLGANTSGNTTASGSTIGWSGGNGVTLSGTNNSQVVISVSTYNTVGTATIGYAVASANSIGTISRWAAEDHRHAGIGAIGISTSGTAGTTGSVQGTYWFQGGNNITVSQITSNNGSHSLAISGPSLTAYLTTARASNDAVGLATAKTNVTWTVNSNGISLDAGNYAGVGTSATNASITLNSAGLAISVAAPGGGSPNFSAGTTSNNLASVVFSNSNGISFGLNGSTITATVATNYQSQGAYLTTAMASNRGSDFVQATAAFAGTNASGTIASNGISVSVAAPVTTNGLISAVNFSAGTTSGNQTGVTWLNSNGISFGLNAGTLTATVQTNWQTSGAYLTTARASNDAVGLDTALTANGVSWTVNSSGLSLNVPAFLTTAALSNHSHGNPTLNLTNLSGTTASNSAGFTLSLSAAALVTESLYWRPNDMVTSVGAPIVNSMSVIYSPLDHNLSATRFDLLGSVNVATTTVNSSAGVLYSMTAAIFTLNAGTLSSVSSATTAGQMTWTSNATGSVTGGFFFSVPMNVNAAPDKYWVGVQLSTRGTGLTGAATTSLANTITLMGVGTALMGAFSARELGAGTANSAGWLYGMGMYSGTTNFSTVGLSNITQQGTNAQRANVALRLIGI